MTRLRLWAAVVAMGVAAQSAGESGRAAGQEARTMSDSNDENAIRAQVTATLARYDQTHAPSLLQDVGDEITREDGAVPQDAAAGKAIGEARLALWAEVFARFKRDLDPDFDPEHAPSAQVTPPPFNGVQLRPGVDPAKIADPSIRTQYEAHIAKNERRVKEFVLQSNLHQVHASLLDRAGASILDAHQMLGLSAAEIGAALEKGDMLDADRAALKDKLK
jgi:hypothetical protein